MQRWVYAFCWASARTAARVAYKRLFSCRPDRHAMPPEPLTPFQARVKAGTLVVTISAGIALLLHDWGPGNVFSPIRPAVKAALDRVFGVESDKKQP